MCTNAMYLDKMTCKRGFDVVTHHNSLKVFIQQCQFAHVTYQVEVGIGWGSDSSEKSRTWPADVLIRNWSLGKPAALDLTVTHAEILPEASVTAIEHYSNHG